MNLTKKQTENLQIIIAYCHRMSRLVVPIEAKRDGLIAYGGEVCDFLKDLSVSISNEEFIDLEDEFYGKVFEEMKDSVQ